MTRVKFAVVCDICNERGVEYGGGYICRHCDVEMADACDCAVDRDDETGKARCPDCAARRRAELVAVAHVGEHS